MPKKTKAEFETLVSTLPDATKADLFSLWSEIEETEKRVTELTKANKDADEIVKNAPAVEKERNDLKAKTLDLETKLAALTGKPSDEIELSAFAPLFDLLG